MALPQLTTAITSDATDKNDGVRRKRKERGEDEEERRGKPVNKG